ncbi:hypothetical protein QUB47_18580 [Microcoleus sp. AT9_B5]
MLVAIVCLVAIGLPRQILPSPRVSEVVLESQRLFVSIAGVFYLAFAIAPMVKIARPCLRHK